MPIAMNGISLKHITLTSIPFQRGTHQIVFIFRLLYSVMLQKVIDDSDCRFQGHANILLLMRI